MKSIPGNLVVLTMAALAVTLTVRTAPAQSSAPVSATPVASATRMVGFRATSWKTIHSHSQTQAQQTVATLKKLGCEVESESHGDHIDVRYRCPEWRSMKVETDTLMNQWSMWCSNQGMETVVVNPPANTRKPTVQFRLVEAKTVHLHDTAKAEQIINTLNLVGCRVETSQHDGHLDMTYASPDWITLELESEKSAHAWQAWLKESGFETRHTHVK